jgi:hypothetical protein
MWMKLDELSEQDILTTVDKNQVFTDSRFMRLIRNGTLSISNMTYSEKKEEVTSEIKLEKGKWYHIAITEMSMQVKKLYINGESKGYYDSSTRQKDSAGMVADIHLGGIKYESELFDYSPFKGAISEFTLHNRALSESEIKRIYESAHVK